MSRLGQCYVLKLEGGYWYVGYTTKGMDRIQQHLDSEGAKWTQKHPPIDPIPYIQTKPGKTRAYKKNKPHSDEDKLTLKLMKEHGIENVRGGSWTMAKKMRQKTIRELEELIGKTKTKASTKKKPVKKKFTKNKEKHRCNGTKRNGDPCRQRVVNQGGYCKYHTDQARRGRKKVICAKCNRVGHESKECYAKTKVAGTGVFAHLERKGLPKR